VLLHEIFGVNAHIREVCDGYAGRGYITLAPALFDRVERGVELGYDAEGIEKGRRLREAIGWEETLLDVQAAVDVLRSAGPVAVIGYCWGGTLAFLSTTRLEGVACAVGYYGGQTVPFAREVSKAPLMLHFGEFDPRIPSKDVEEIRLHNPQVEMHIFPADHGFNCDHRKEWHEPSAQEALNLTLDFLDRHMR
jgi:carboxymethylenebutenolidase